MSASITRRICRLLTAQPNPAWKTVALQRDIGRFVTFANPLSVYIAARNMQYLDDLACADEVLADGILMSEAASRITGRRVQRHSFDGNSLADRVFSFCNEHGLRLAVIGGIEGVASTASAVISREYPDLQIPVIRNGFFSSNHEYSDLICALEEAEVNVVIIGMGAPHQETLMMKLKNAGVRGAVFSCGGYLDQLGAGRIAYYPRLIEKFNLRAAYRLFREPRRLTRRYFIEYGDFYVGASSCLFRSAPTSGTEVSSKEGGGKR